MHRNRFSGTGPAIVDLSVLVPTLCRLLKSTHLVLRQSAVACLRQFAQREAKEVCEHAMAMFSSQSVKDTHSLDALHFTETGKENNFCQVILV